MLSEKEFIQEYFLQKNNDFELLKIGDSFKNLKEFIVRLAKITIPKIKDQLYAGKSVYDLIHKLENDEETTKLTELELLFSYLIIASNLE